MAVGTDKGNKLTCNSPGNACLQSSELAGPLWPDPGLQSEIGVCKPTSTKKKILNAGED